MLQSRENFPYFLSGRGNVCTIVVRANLYTIEVYQFSPLEIQTWIWIETLNNKFLQYKIER
jgi:hypothetical protein